MVESKSQIKKAFLAASGKVQLQALKEELRQRSIEPLTTYELPVMGTSILEHIERSIRKSDLFIAILVAEPSSNVLFELGLAHGLGKHILLLVSPKYGKLPSDISGRFYVRANPDNREAIGFALDQILASSRKKSRRQIKPSPSEHPLGDKVDHYLKLIHDRGKKLTEKEMEEIVVELLKASGVSNVTQSPFPDQGADIAVWSDDLQTTVGNPLIIEVKSRLQNREKVRPALEQVELYRKKSNTQWALLILPLFSSAIASIPFTGSVLALTITELLENLRNKSFAETIRELRNARVHGRI